MPTATPISHRSDNPGSPLLNSDVQLRRFIDMMPAIAWRSAPDGSREFHTPLWHGFTGLSPEEAHGWGWLAAIHPDDLQRMTDETARLRAAGQPGELEYRVRRSDGLYEWFVVRSVPCWNDAGELTGWYGCNVNIEDRKKAEQGLRREQDALRNVIDAISDLIAVIAPDGSLLYANRCFTDYTGYGNENVASGQFREFVFHADELAVMKSNRQIGMDAGVPFAQEARIRRRDGQYRWQLIRYSPLRDESGTITRWYATGMDIHERHLAAARLQNENVALREEITRSSMFEEIVGSSTSIRRVLDHVAKVAPSDSTVLVLGETGTGKELIARAVHALSPRSTKAFIRVNCAAIPPSLIASELFGHEKGAFTGATQRRLGRFETADGGTLFLDEIGDLPAETQIALLRVLQEHEFERVGSNHPTRVDVRVVAATNRDLMACVRAGAFRQDLYYRLNVFPIQLPNLRDRKSDIPLLVEYFIERYARKAGKRIAHISKDTLGLFCAYDWPGNIRELQNVIERGVILSDGPSFSIDENWLVKQMPVAGGSPEALGPAIAERETELIKNALAESGGRISGPGGAAARLKLPRQTLTSKMKALGIARDR
jgi:formate hydrogenlyase transcriptional activator